MSLIAESGELVVGGVEDLGRVDDFLAQCQTAKIDFPRIFCDSSSPWGPDLWAALSSRLSSSPRCVAYLAKADVKAIGEPSFRQVLASAYVMDGGEADANSRLSRVAAVHRIGAVQALLFWLGDPFLRVADAHVIDLSGQPQEGPVADRLNAARHFLLEASLDAVDRVLGDLREELEELRKQVDSLKPKRLWVAWERAREIVELSSATLSGQSGSLPQLANLRRLREAELLLREAVGECRRLGIGELQAVNWLKVESSEEERRALARDLEVTYQEGNVLLADFAVDLTKGSRLRYSKGVLRWPFRVGGVPQARAACRRLLLLLDKVLNSSEFRGRFGLNVFDRVWHDLDEVDSGLVPSDRLDLREALRASLGRLRGARVVLVLPPRFKTESEEARNWIEGRSGIPCFAVHYEGANGWLYWKDAFREPGGVSASLPAAQREPIDQPEKVSKSVPLSEGEAPAIDAAVIATDLPERIPIQCQCEARSVRWGGKPVPKICPVCGGYNWHAWWQCFKHGKVPVDVSSADERCPECIIRHHENPDRYPISTITLRPDLQERVYCPHCLDLRRHDSSHPVFRLPVALVPFFREGVRGEDAEIYYELAQKAGLPDYFRCPNCRTLLIPVHHRSANEEASESPVSQG